MGAEHPLAQKPVIRLRDCLEFSAILPPAADGIRQLLNVGLIRRNIALKTVIETDSRAFLHSYLPREQLLSFQIPIAMPDGMIDAPAGVGGIVARPVDESDVPPGVLHLGQLKGRVLPVAAAKFLDSLITSLSARYGHDMDQ